MTAKKFDINNLPDLKIRVANAEESEAAQRAFFALGSGWTWRIEVQLREFNPKQRWIYSESPSKFLSGRLYTYSDMGVHVDAVEITLLELEALAAEKQGNADEQVAELRGNGISFEIKTDGIYLRNGKHYHFAAGQYDDFGEMICNGKGVIVKPLSPSDVLILPPPSSEAQSRYEAALELLQGVVDKQKVGLWANLKKALQIAAGLEQPTQSTDTKSDKP